MLKIHNNKNIESKAGFVLVFSLVLTSILFAIALGLSNIALKQTVFSISAKNSNDAFLAADSGAECALYLDLGGSQSAFGADPGDILNPTIANCAGTDLDVSSPTGPWTFYLYGLGSTGNACSEVMVQKNAFETNITSKGYSTGGQYLNCASNSSNRVERELLVSYQNPGVGLQPGYPAVLTTNSSFLNGNSANHVVNLPPGIDEGDLVLIFFSSDANFPDVSFEWPGSIGWENMGSLYANTHYFEARYFIATNNEVGMNNFTITSSRFGAAFGEISTHQTIRIKKGTYSFPVYFSEIVNNLTANPNPDSPSLVLPGSVKKNLWISAVGRETGRYIVTESFPANYSSGVSVQGFCNTAGSSMDIARREIEANTENPGPFNLINETVPSPSCPSPGTSSNDFWKAITVAVKGV